jgi:putative membrane protein
MKKISILLLTAVLFTAPAFAQSDKERSAASPDLGTTPKEEEFVKEAAATDLFELASAKLATQRGDDNVKSFAEKMITDHTETTDALKELVSSGKVHAELPAEMTIQQSTQIKRLESLQGAAFKKQYVIDQALAHKNAALKLRLPRRDLVGMDVEMLGQLSQRHLALDGGQRHLRLECRIRRPI